MPDVEITVDERLLVADGAGERQLNVNDFSPEQIVAIRAAVEALADVAGTVSLSPATLAALEAVTVSLSGAVALDPATLAALETITVANPTANPETGLAKEQTLGNRFAGGKLPHTDTITAAGDTETLAPAAGNRLNVFWVQAMNMNPDAEPRIIVKFAGGLELYRGPVISHFEPFPGAPDEALIVNLSEAAQVELTVHYMEE